MRRVFTKQQFDTYVYFTRKGSRILFVCAFPPILKQITFKTHQSTTAGVQAYDNTTKIWTIYNFSTNDRTAGQSNVMSFLKRSVDGRNIAVHAYASTSVLRKELRRSRLKFYAKRNREKFLLSLLTSYYRCNVIYRLYS